MPSYRYTLQPYKGPASRYACPQCNSKRKTFVRYIDTQTGHHLADHVGRCGRQDSCGYHFTPKQFFENNETYETRPLWRGVRGVSARAKKKQSGSERITLPSIIPATHWQSTLKNYERNNLIQYLVTKFGGATVGKLIQRYHIGTSKKWDGATVFWQLDEQGYCRDGKIMLYNRDTGKRIKEPFNHISWVHTLKDKNDKPLYPDFKLKQCLFGEHLLKESNALVLLVESEKTALIASIYNPEQIVIATGGKEAFTKERCAPLRNRPVLIYPDMGSFDNWTAKAKECLKFYDVIAPPKGAKDGEDVGDWLMER